MIHLARTLVRTFALVGTFAILVSSVQAQLTPEQQADMTITSARKAFNEKNYPFARDRFREYLAKFANQKDAASARYGLALSLINGPAADRKDDEVVALLTQLAGDGAFAERPQAAYQLGLVFRTIGLADLAKGETTPAELPQRLQAAKARFEQAANTFGQALTLFTAAVKDPASPDFEWLARSRADQAEMLLRVGKTKEALAAAEPFIKDANFAKSKYKDFGRYLFAQAAFLSDDLPSAQKTLTMLAPFASPDWGPHARYLLARTHHLADERGDALAQYEATIADHKKHIENAQNMLKNPASFKNDPVKRAELEAFIKQLAPDHVARANFYLGVLLYEAGRFGEAKAKFQDFVKMFPQSPLKVEADLRIGYCQVQQKEYAEAIKTLQPITANPKLADQAFLWLGKAQIGIGPDKLTKFAEYKAQAGNGINSMKAALDNLAKLGAIPEAKVRRGEILLDMGDALLDVREPKQAADTYQVIVNENLLPERNEEVMLRLAQAYHQVKNYDESDARVNAFFQKHPKSTLAAAAAFTFAENAFFRAAALEKALEKQPAADREKQLAPAYGEALKRMEAVIQKYPEYPKILLVRYSVGLTNYRLGQFDKAFKAWSEIPVTERNGELSLTPFLMADCVLRQTPASLPADADALATGKVDEQLKAAVELLDGYIGANPKEPSAPDATLKLGLCLQRRASMLSEPKDKQPVLAAARATYEKFLGLYPKDPQQPNAVYERAKVIAAQGDIGGATNELRRFTQDPLRTSKIAPMAAISLATLLRAQNQPAQAADVLQKAREAHEGPLAQDQARANWIPLMRFHQAVALREASKLPEARGLFDQVIKQSPKSAEGIEAALRLGQTMREEGLGKLEESKKYLGNPKEAPKGQSLQNEGYKFIRDAATFLETTADSLKAIEGSQEPRARMLYDAAWGNRLLAEPEVQSAKAAIAKDIAAKANIKLPLPDVTIEQVPLQPSEKKARGLYKALVDQFGDVPLSVEARFELAELLSQRNEHDPALQLLNDALDKEPGVDITEKIRLRLGSIHAAKGNEKAALAQFEAIAQNPKSQNLPWAFYRAAEVNLANKQYPEAVKRLTPFRDNGQFQNVPGLSDRALLRLGHAYSNLKAWGESYQALERCVNAFPQSPWVDEARYGMGWAMQKQGNFDGAVNWYNQVVARSATELAAKAQYQIGASRMEQKRFPEAATAFMAVPTTYDYPEWSATALLEAARCYAEAKNQGEATKIYERVIRDYPNTPFAEAAKEQVQKK